MRDRERPSQVGREPAPPPASRFPWDGARRVLSAAVGGGLLLLGARRRSVVGVGTVAVGVGLLVRGLNHQDVRRLLGLQQRARRRAVEWGQSRQVRVGSDWRGREAARRLVREIMTRHVAVMHPAMPVQEAAERMKTLDVGALPVCEDGRVVGIMTDRDIVLRVVAEQRDPRNTAVADAMSDDVICGTEDQSVYEAGLLMVERRVRRLPVLDGNGGLVGMVSLGDVAVHGQDSEWSGEVLEFVSQPAEPRRER